MNQKFLIVLFATVLYNGVTNSSPTNGQTSSFGLNDGKPPTVSLFSPNHTNTKVESLPISHNIPSSYSEKNSTVEHSTKTVSSTAKNIEVVNPPAVDVKNPNQDSIVKNINQTINDKHMSTVNISKNTSQVIDDKISTPAAVSIIGTVPNLIPTGKNSPSIPPKEVTTSPKSSPVPTVVTAKTSIKPEISTVAPDSTSVDKVVDKVEHNKPAPSEENHFDGPSFIGGIVLTIGLTAIGFIAFKYYKSSKTDRNYRTL